MPDLSKDPMNLVLDFDGLMTYEIELIEDYADVSFFELMGALEMLEADDDGNVDPATLRNMPRMGKVMTAMGLAMQQRVDPTVTFETMAPVMLAEDPRKARGESAELDDSTGDEMGAPDGVNVDPLSQPPSVAGDGGGTATT